MRAFAEYLNLNLEDRRIELISVDGISFYSFIHLFNSSNPEKRLGHPAAIITDDDRYAKHDRTFKTLSAKNFNALNGFHTGLYCSGINNRTGNLASVIHSRKTNVKLMTAFKTLEHEIALANVALNKTDFPNNFLVQFLSTNEKVKYVKIDGYLKLLPNEVLSAQERQKLAILVWKALPSKATFAQDFSLALETAVQKQDVIVFNVPSYLTKSIKHVTRRK